MKKLSVKDLIDFRRRTDRGKRTFVENIKSNKIATQGEGGGDYWIGSLSAVCNSYRKDDLRVIDAKIDELQEKLSATTYTITRDMYRRNVAILQQYKSMDLRKKRPTGTLSFLKKSTGNPLLTIKGLEIEAKPSLIYTYGRKDEEYIGAIWFVAKLNGYRREEIGMFCDLLHRFLKQSYTKRYQLNPEYCIAVDVLSGRTVNYSAIENGSLSKALTPTIEEITKLM